MGPRPRSGWHPGGPGGQPQEIPSYESFAGNLVPPPDEQARGQLLRLLASDAMRGALERPHGITRRLPPGPGGGCPGVEARC